MDRIHAAVSGGCLHGITQSSLQEQFPIGTTPATRSKRCSTVSTSRGWGCGHLLYRAL